MLRPRNIAIIGASNDPDKIGGRPVDYLKRYGFAGPVYPVNPNYSVLQGIECYASIDDVPDNIDLAIIALPRELVLPALEQCGRKQVKSVVIFSSGFGELGEQGKVMQHQIRDIALQYDMNVLGPNCQGIANLKEKSVALFSTSFADGDLSLGSSAIVSQSGAVAAMVYKIQKELGKGTKFWISTGNEAQLTAADFVYALAEDPEVKVIQLYIEDIKDGQTFLQAITKAQEMNKPVLALKAAKTPAGRRAASSHTGALAGEDEVYATVFKRFGVVRVDTVIELATFPQVFELGKSAKGRRVAVLSNSGGLGVMMVDQCLELGLELAPFTPRTIQELREILPVFATPQNPIDLTAQILNDKTLLSKTLSILTKDPTVDVIVIGLGIIGRGYDIPQIIEDIAAAQRQTDSLIALAWVGSQKDSIRQFAQRGVPIFEDPSLCLKAVSKFVDYSLSAPQDIAVNEQYKPMTPVKWPKSGGFLNEFDSKQILKQWGLPITKERWVKTKSEAIDAAVEIGYPVALKILSSDILHKTDVGGVVLNLHNERELLAAYEDIIGRAKGLEANIDGLLVQEMVARDGLEMSLGFKNDPTFGPVIMVASGGIYIEVFKDIKLLIPPVTSQLARDAVLSLKVASLLQGVRGRSPLDIDSLCEAIVAFSKFVCSVDGVQEIDINPIVVFPSGQGVKVVDALIKLS